MILVIPGGVGKHFEMINDNSAGTTRIMINSLNPSPLLNARQPGRQSAGSLDISLVCWN